MQQWSLGSPAMHNGLFWGVLGFGLLIGLVAFLLMGQPFAREKGKGSPLLGAICGSIFFASFWLLATQMVANRFFGLQLTAHEVVLSMADGSSLSVKRDKITRFGFQSEMNSRYVVISTQDGEFYRGGPCAQDCGQMAESIDAWMRVGSDNAER